MKYSQLYPTVLKKSSILATAIKMPIIRKNINKRAAVIKDIRLS